MTEDNKDTTGKWSAPTSSYEDAQTIKKFVKKMKDQAQEQKEKDKPTS